MQIKNVTESAINILKEWLYLKNMLDWSDPKKQVDLELVVTPSTATRMRLNLENVEAQTILLSRIQKLEQEIKKL